MGSRHAREAEIGEYTAYHFNATTTDQLIATDHQHGSFLGYVVVGTLGTTPVIKLGNGTTGTAGNIISTITPTAPGTFIFQCVCDKGLYISITGTGMDVTVMALPEAI